MKNKLLLLSTKSGIKIFSSVVCLSVYRDMKLTRNRNIALSIGSLGGRLGNWGNDGNGGKVGNWVMGGSLGCNWGNGGKGGKGGNLGRGGISAAPITLSESSISRSSS